MYLVVWLGSEVRHCLSLEGREVFEFKCHYIWISSMVGLRYYAPVAVIPFRNTRSVPGLPHYLIKNEASWNRNYYMHFEC